MHRLIAGLLFLCAAGSAWAGQPITGRDLVVSVTGTTHGAYSELYAPAVGERYAIVTLRTGDGLTARVSRSAAPNTYTANGNYRPLAVGEELELWPLGTATKWYADTTATAGTLTFDVRTFSLSWP